MKKKKGFTLVELLVVVAVIGFLASISVYSYNGYVKGAKIKSAKNFLMQISLAQTEEYSNAGEYWQNTAASGCDVINTIADGEKLSASTKDIGLKLFGDEKYVDGAMGFNFCATTTTNGFIAKADDNSGCILTINEKGGSVDETQCP